MTKKVFYGTVCLGILFSLALLVLLPAQIVVNFDADGLPQDIASKWVFIALMLLFQMLVLAFFSVAPFFINHAYRAEAWRDDGMKMFRLFLPSALTNETKMRKLRERVLNLFWVMGMTPTFFLAGMQWYVAANNGTLPALFAKDVGGIVVAVGLMTFFVVVSIMICFTILDFMIPDKKRPGPPES